MGKRRRVRLRSVEPRRWQTKWAGDSRRGFGRIWAGAAGIGRRVLEGAGKDWRRRACEIRIENRKPSLRSSTRCSVISSEARNLSSSLFKRQENDANRRGHLGNLACERQAAR